MHQFKLLLWIKVPIHTQTGILLGGLGLAGTGGLIIMAFITADFTTAAIMVGIVEVGIVAVIPMAAEAGFMVVVDMAAEVDMVHVNVDASAPAAHPHTDHHASTSQGQT